MKKAVWGSDYDMHTDTCFQRPLCPDCIDLVPIFRRDSERPDIAECINCHKEFELTEEMKNWLEAREETKEEIDTCIRCKQKTMKIHYVRNDVNLKWQTAYGSCEKCGTRFIV